MARDKTYFISDLHLGAGYISDPRAHEAKAVRFLRRIAPECRRLFLLGDILDYWWEYRTVVPRGFTRFFGALAELADAGVEIVWFKGNHDVWIFDYLAGEIGLKVHDGIMVAELDGKRFLMEHGDGIGELPRAFRCLRALFRCRTAQRMYAAVHPRWTIGFAHRWSSHSRKQGGYKPSGEPGEAMARWAEEYNARAGEKVDYFIFGHIHALLRRRLAGGAEMVVLGDWINIFSFAVWDGNSLKVEKFDD